MGAIGIDWQVLLAQFVNFAILFGLLSVLLYKPMRRMLDEQHTRLARPDRLQLPHFPLQIPEVG